MSVCDWISKWRYDRALKRGKDALERSAFGYARISDALAEAAARDKNAEIRSIVDKMATAKAGEVAFADGDYYVYNRQSGASVKIKAEPRPDTVESVLNQFIALGYEKPEVVIKGETMLDGSERWTATIDGKSVEFISIRFAGVMNEWGRISLAERAVVVELKKMLRLTVKTETTITY